MATMSMHTSENAFGNLALQLSPAFRSVHERALRERTHSKPQRAFDQQKLSELARSDEFSDDESDGVDSDDEQSRDDDDTDESADTFEDRKPAAHSALGATPRRHSPYHRAQAASATETIDLDDDLVDIKETMYVPYRQSPRTDRSPRMDRFMQRRAGQQRRLQHDAAPSPKSDDWTLVDKSPTFERLARATSSSSSSRARSRLDASSNWFSKSL